MELSIPTSRPFSSQLNRLASSTSTPISSLAEANLLLTRPTSSSTTLVPHHTAPYGSMSKRTTVQAVHGRRLLMLTTASSLRSSQGKSRRGVRQWAYMLVFICGRQLWGVRQLVKSSCICLFGMLITMGLSLLVTFRRLVGGPNLHSNSTVGLRHYVIRGLTLIGRHEVN